MIKLQGKDISDVKLGNEQVTAIYLGEDEVWSSNKYITVRGKFTDDSTSKDWHCNSNGRIEIDADPDTKEFEVKIGQNVRSLFYGNEKLEKIYDLPINKSITDMSLMFYGCDELNEIRNTQDWDTSNVTNMSYTFIGLDKLTQLDCSGWDVRKLSNIERMISDGGLTSIDLSSWNTERLSHAPSVFLRCADLTSVNLSNWNMKNVGSIGSMFNGCSKLTTIKGLDTWNVSNITGMSSLFKDCNQLTTLNIGNWSVGNVTSFSDIFMGCTNLKAINGTIYNINANISLRTNSSKASEGLNKDITLMIIDGLAEVSTTKTLTLGSTVFEQLTEEEIAVATSKGWTVVGG